MKQNIMWLKIMNDLTKVNFNISYSKLSFIIIEIIIGIPIIIWLSVLIETPTLALKNWIVVVIVIMMLLLNYFWHRSFRIQIKHGTLKYRSFFRQYNEIPLQDIERVYTETGYSQKFSLNRGLFNLVIKPKKTSHVKNFYINLGMFDEKDIQKLFDILKERDREAVNHDTVDTISQSLGIKQNSKAWYNIIIVITGLVGFFVIYLKFGLFGRPIHYKNDLLPFISAWLCLGSSFFFIAYRIFELKTAIKVFIGFLSFTILLYIGYAIAFLKYNY
ncbi:MAG: hypothetical protein JW807_17145 [Spirochaetes bacterium]|nr:hypothetical protein [Spirochaetota bacterium]